MADLHYIIGLFIADGYSHVGKTARLELAEEQIVKDISDLINEGNYSTRKRVIAEKERTFHALSYDFSKIEGLDGSMFKKGRKGAYQYYLSLPYKNDFIRGLFDGDGSISSNMGSPRIGISVNSTQEDIKKIWLDYFKMNNLTPSLYLDKRGVGSWYISLNRKGDVEKFANLIYHPNYNLKINRKYDKFKTFGFPTQ